MPMIKGKFKSISNERNIIGKKISNDEAKAVSSSVGAAPVTSVNSKVGVVVLDKTDIGLDQVNNTSDANKPISDASLLQFTNVYEELDEIQTRGIDLINSETSTSPTETTPFDVDVSEFETDTKHISYSYIRDIGVGTMGQLEHIGYNLLSYPWDRYAGRRVVVNCGDNYFNIKNGAAISDVKLRPINLNWNQQFSGTLSILENVKRAEFIYDADSQVWNLMSYELVAEEGLQLGTTDTTAYRGDRGLVAYTHSQLTSGNPHNVTKSDVGLGSTVDGAEINVQSDWSQATTGADDFIKNKPTIPAAQIQSDWAQTNTGEVDYIKNKPSAMPTGAENHASRFNSSGDLDEANKVLIFEGVGPTAEVFKVMNNEVTPEEIIDVTNDRIRLWERTTNQRADLDSAGWTFINATTSKTFNIYPDTTLHSSAYESDAANNMIVKSDGLFQLEPKNLGPTLINVTNNGAGIIVPGNLDIEMVDDNYYHIHWNITVLYSNQQVGPPTSFELHFILTDGSYIGNDHWYKVSQKDMGTNNLEGIVGEVTDLNSGVITISPINPLGATVTMKYNVTGDFYCLANGTAPVFEIGFKKTDPGNPGDLILRAGSGIDAEMGNSNL